MPAPKRHALGLPAGSVRAAHVLLIVGLVCAIILHPRQMPVPPYLLYLLLMVISHFFASHGAMIATEGRATPLHMPAGLIRFLIIAGLLGTIGFKLFSDENGPWSEENQLYKQFKASIEGLEKEPFLPLVILGSFFMGVCVRSIAGRDNPPQALQDTEAWLSLLALVGLGAAVIIHLVIGPTVEGFASMPHWEGFLAAIIAFYFGARS
jgi:hypothetical protein